MLPGTAGRGLFAEPDFRRLWCVGLVVFVVRWLETLAVSLFVYNATGSAFMVAMLTMLRLLPMGLFGAFLGAWAERVEPRGALLAVVLSSLLSSLALTVLAWAGTLAVWHLALASLLNGLAWAADNPVRRLAIGQVVGAARMGRAMSMDVAASNASRMLGPTLGGVIFAQVGIAGAFALSVALYAVALVAALRLRHRRGRTAVPAGGVLARVAEGLGVVRRDARLKGTLIVTVIFNVWGWPFTSLVPVIGQEHLRLGPEAIGLLASMEGIGALAGALLIALLVPARLYGRCYLGGIALYLAMVTLFALAPHPAPAGAALLLVGLGGAGFSTMQATLVYLAAPTEMRSRVLGLLSVCIGVGPIGFLHIGLLAEAIGAPWACALSGVEGLLALALTRRWWRAI
jgi:MFS family permease